MGGKGQHKKQGQSLQQWPVIKFTHFCEIENKHVTAKMEAGLRVTLLGFTVSSTTFRTHSEVALNGLSFRTTNRNYSPLVGNT